MLNRAETDMRRGNSQAYVNRGLSNLLVQSTESDHNKMILNNIKTDQEQEGSISVIMPEEDLKNEHDRSVRSTNIPGIGSKNQNQQRNVR